jgi:hypothetical protein
MKHGDFFERKGEEYLQLHKRVEHHYEGIFDAKEAERDLPLRGSKGLPGLLRA